MDDALFAAIDNITEETSSNVEIDPEVLIKTSENFKSTNEIVEDKQEKEDTETENETNKEVVEEKPWKIDENGKKVSTMVPKTRFDEKNNLAKELEAKLKERDERLAKYEEENTKLNLDLSHIKPENYDTFEQYIEARDKESFKIQRNIIKQEIEHEKIVERVKTAETNLIQGFDKNIEDTAKEIPDIVNVVSEFAKYKEYIPRETIYTIMGDENSAKVIHEIMTTENMLRNLSEMSPVQAARVIGKLSAKFDLQKEYSENSSQSRSEKPAGIPSTPIPQKPKVAGSPNLKGASDKSVVRDESNSRIISKKESEEFAKLFSSR